MPRTRQSQIEGLRFTLDEEGQRQWRSVWGDNTQQPLPAPLPQNQEAVAARTPTIAQMETERLQQLQHRGLDGGATRAEPMVYSSRGYVRAGGRDSNLFEPVTMPNDRVGMVYYTWDEFSRPVNLFKNNKEKHIMPEIKVNIEKVNNRLILMPASDAANVVMQISGLEFLVPRHVYLMNRYFGFETKVVKGSSYVKDKAIPEYYRSMISQYVPLG